ncbi:hypothetical protein [Serratia marcescens]|uniref:hypothetical protein n=1 Tax=Serratia marcescens TaxID=615 RepID=UPI0027E4A6BE|nr:hypothetical protein [Serratia marcescens]
MISTEQLRKTIEECTQKRPSGQSVVFTSKFVEALARELLANREAPPVRFLNKFSGVCVTLEQQPNAADDVAVYSPLYTAQPVAAVPDAVTFESKGYRALTLYDYGWNDCRAAMLAAVPEVSGE